MFKLSKLSLSKQLIFFLRHTKSFVKSRYSRGRQWSKVIVYFGLWFNIGSVLGSFFFCYQFSFRLSYCWWILFILVNSFLFRLFVFRSKISINFVIYIKLAYKFLCNFIKTPVFDFNKIKLTKNFNLSWVYLI